MTLHTEILGVPNTIACFLIQVSKWEGDNQLCRVYCFSTTLFPEWHSSCPAPLQSLLLTHGYMTSPTPLWPPMAMTSLEQMPPLPGPVTSITAPFYDASFRCQVCLLLTGGCGVTLNATEHEGPKPYISLSSIWGSVGSGLPNNQWEWLCGFRRPLSGDFPHVWWLHTENWNWWSLEASSAIPHSPPDQLGVLLWQSGQRRPTWTTYRLF